MRVICPCCGEKARIGKTNRITAKVADLYCSCCDPECGHTFVVNLCYSHTLSPSAKTTSELAVSLVRALSPEKQQQLCEQLSMLWMKSFKRSQVPVLLVIGYRCNMHPAPGRLMSSTVWAWPGLLRYRQRQHTLPKFLPLGINLTFNASTTWPWGRKRLSLSHICLPLFTKTNYLEMLPELSFIYYEKWS